MSNMSERLLQTLDAVSARDEVAQDAMKKTALKPGVDYDETTGEWLGDPPEGYQGFEMPPSLSEVVSKESKVPEYEDTDATTDYKRIRDTTYAMQEATMFMMGKAAELAASTEAPRAFSVFRELGELMRGLNKDLMENQKTIKDVTRDKEPPGETTVEVSESEDGTTTVKVGKTARSSRDLLQMIEKVRRDAEANRNSRVNPGEEVIDVAEEPKPEEKSEGEDDGVSEA